MPRGSSVHFRPVASPALCEAHNRRAVSPEYLLPEAERLPNVEVRGGDIAAVYAQKMALASGKARHTTGYSPLKEGVVNLDDEPPPRLEARMARWCAEYERITGERVVSCVVHRDEGRVTDAGEVRRNVHAHVVIDRTNERGRVVLMQERSKQRALMREVQTMTAAITGLERGQDARQSKRQHVPHRAYRAVARSQETARQVERHELAQARELVAEIGERFRVARTGDQAADYKALRAAMKGQASQADYMALKAAHEALVCEAAERSARADRAEAEREQARVSLENSQAATIAQRHYRPGLHCIQVNDQADHRGIETPWLVREWDERARCAVYRDPQTKEAVLLATRTHVELLRDTDNDVKSALKIAASKFNGAVFINGSAAFRERAARHAVRLGIKVANPGLAKAVEDERALMRQEAERQRRGRGPDVSGPDRGGGMSR